MHRQNFLHVFLFVFFFSVGVASLSGSILSEDLLRYYRNNQLLKTAEKSLKELESLNADYDMLLRQLQKDPDFVKRIAPAAMGTQPANADATYPKAKAEQLATARKALTDDSAKKTAEPTVPRWVVRCNALPRRIALFFCGSFLVLISFIFFSPSKQSEQQQTIA
jgi:hypothetical protein